MTAVFLFGLAVLFLAAVTAAGWGFSEKALVTDFSRKNLQTPYRQSEHHRTLSTGPPTAPPKHR